MHMCTCLAHAHHGPDPEHARRGAPDAEGPGRPGGDEPVGLPTAGSERNRSAALIGGGARSNFPPAGGQGAAGAGGGGSRRAWLAAVTVLDASVVLDVLLGI